MADRTDPEGYLPLAPHTFQILLSLLDHGPLHGYSIIKDVEGRTEGRTKLGTSTAYAAIKRLVRDGLLEPALAPPGTDSEGPRRRYYRLTPFGRDVARAEGLRIVRLQRMVARTSLLDGNAPGNGAKVEP
ncbi:MAG: PadR family transcriptional regulator [Gemmatimonadota bacterium]|jgi:DNA-binding PadR family transcriptional regulator